MWIILLLLLLIPLCYYFVDSAVALFPSLAQMLPAKTAVVQPVTSNAVTLGPDGQPEVPGRWYVSQTPKGYLAWTLSTDGAYRLAAGCRALGSAAIQVTSTDGKSLGPNLHLNFEYGSLALGPGAYAGSDLVGAVSQFKTLYLQHSNRAVVAQFDVDSAESQSIARTLQQDCSPAAESH